jgi:Domain of unknown function (DUF397)
MIENNTGREFELKCNGGAGCVIVEKAGGCIVIRDSKNPTQPGLVFSKKEYADFRRRVRDDTWFRAALGFMGSLLSLLVLGLRQITR